MRDAGVAATVITYNSLINCYARARDAAGAERVLVTMREEAGVRRRDRGAKMPAVLFTVYNVVCCASCVMRCAVVCTMCVAHASQYAFFSPSSSPFLPLLLPQVLPTHVTYNSLLNAYAKKRDVAGARRVAQQMSDAGIEWDVVTYVDRIGRMGFSVYSSLV